MQVSVFMHKPPKLDGCPLEDSQCMACQLALSPTSSFFSINLCEKDLLGGSAHTNCLIDDSAGRGYTLDQVSYVVEMCEDTFKVQCPACNEVLSRADFRDHTC